MIYLCIYISFEITFIVRNQFQYIYILWDLFNWDIITVQSYFYLFIVLIFHYYESILIISTSLYYIYCSICHIISWNCHFMRWHKPNLFCLCTLYIINSQFCLYDYYDINYVSTMGKSCYFLCYLTMTTNESFECSWCSCSQGKFGGILIYILLSILE